MPGQWGPSSQTLGADYTVKSASLGAADGLLANISDDSAELSCSRRCRSRPQCTTAGGQSCSGRVRARLACSSTCLHHRSLARALCGTEPLFMQVRCPPCRTNRLTAGQTANQQNKRFQKDTSKGETTLFHLNWLRTQGSHLSPSKISASKLRPAMM